MKFSQFTSGSHSSARDFTHSINLSDTVVLATMLDTCHNCRIQKRWQQRLNRTSIIKCRGCCASISSATLFLCSYHIWLTTGPSKRASSRWPLPTAACFVLAFATSQDGDPLRDMVQNWVCSLGRHSMFRTKHLAFLCSMGLQTCYEMFLPTFSNLVRLSSLCLCWPQCLPSWRGLMIPGNATSICQLTSIPFPNNFVEPTQCILTPSSFLNLLSSSTSRAVTARSSHAHNNSLYETQTLMSSSTNLFRLSTVFQFSSGEPSARCTWHNLVDLTCATELSLSLSLAPPARARLQSHDLRCLIVPLGTAASFMACHHAQSRSGKDRPCSKTHTQTIWNQLLLWQMHRVSKMPHMICVWFRMWSFLTTPKA